MGKTLHRFPGDFLERAVAVHRLQYPPFGEARFREYRHKLSRVLLEIRGREDASVKVGLAEMDRSAARIPCRYPRFPSPYVVISDQVRMQVDFADFAFPQLDRLKPRQEGVPIDRLAGARFGRIADAVPELGLKPKAQAVPNPAAAGFELHASASGSFRAGHVVEAVPRLHVGEHLLRLQALPVDSV